MRLRKIIKIVATRCQILRLECTKFDFGWGSAPLQTPLGELTALPQSPKLDLRGPTSKGGEGRGRGEGRKGNGREGREGRGNEPPPPKSWIRPCDIVRQSQVLVQNGIDKS